MVKAFEILCPFFNIRPSVSIFLYFFQMKLTGKIGWVSLNNVSKKLFEFDSNVFCCFKDRFFKVLDTGDVQVDPTRFKSFDEDLLTLVERVDKAILEQLLASLDVQAM